MSGSQAGGSISQDSWFDAGHAGIEEVLANMSPKEQLQLRPAMFYDIVTG